MNSGQKLIGLLLGAALLLLLAGGVVYNLWGHGLVGGLYDGNGPEVLSRALSGRNVWPVSHYLDAADRVFCRAMTIAAAVWLCFSAAWLGTCVNGRLGKYQRYIPFVGMALIFAISILVRWPALGRHLSDKLESSTAHVLIAMENLDMQGIWAGKLGVLQTYPNEADLHIQTWAGRYIDSEGRGYYTSAPAVYVLLPLFLFKILFIPITEFSLELLNVVLHLASSLFVYAFLLLALDDRPYRKSAALTGLGIFVLAAPHLWFFSNFYTWDTLHHYVWAIALAHALWYTRALRRGDKPRHGLALFGLVNFSMLMTGVPGALYTLSVFVLAMVEWRKSARLVKVLTAFAVSTALAVILAGLHYFWICGFAVQPLMDALLTRTGIASPYGPIPYWNIPKRYAVYYWYLLIPMIPMLFLARGKTGGAGLNHYIKWLFFLTLLPVLLHHLLFIEWNAWELCSVTRSAFFMAAVFAWLMQISLTAVRHHPAVRAVLVGLLLSSGVLAVDVYRNQLALSNNTDKYYNLGREIAVRVSNEDVVFGLSEKDSVFVLPQVQYYARRNIKTVESPDEAREWLCNMNMPRGVLFEVEALENGYRIAHVDRIDL